MTDLTPVFPRIPQRRRRGGKVRAETDHVGLGDCSPARSKERLQMNNPLPKRSSKAAAELSPAASQWPHD